MKKVLVTGGYNIGKAGVATIVYRWGQNFDSNILRCDYLMAKGFPDEQYIQAIKRKGGNVLAPKKKLSWIKKISWIFDSIKNGQYDLIHINIDVAYKAMIYIIIARLAGINKIILHSHCSFVDENRFFVRNIKIFFHYVSRGYCRRSSKELLACSKEAALWMFGKKVVRQNTYRTIFNGIDINKYKYDSILRDIYRKDFAIRSDEFVLCNVSRFSYQKNHFLLIDIFEELAKKKSNCKLVLIGVGSLYDDIVRYADFKGVSDKVLFMGQRNDVEKLLNMMDVFVLPSRFEGLPLVLVEAQFAMLPCVVSDAVSKEAKITNYFEFIHGSELYKWVDAIINFEGIRRENLEIDDAEKYSIQNNAKMLQSILDAV